jgi:hypothetical protein
MTHRCSEPPLASVRRQAALARTLLDELESIAPMFEPARAPSAQAIEELTRLGCRIFEAAALLASEEEATGSSRPAKCLGAQVEADPVGVDSPTYGHAAVESGRG